jgi:hypothetical protein
VRLHDIGSAIVVELGHRDEQTEMGVTEWWYELRKWVDKNCADPNWCSSHRGQLLAALLLSEKNRYSLFSLPQDVIRFSLISSFRPPDGVTITSYSD